MKNILQALRANVAELTPTANCFNVVRSDILQSAIRTVQRRAFNPTCKIDVVFMDTLDGSREGSVDTGGPTREFLTLLMRAILASRFFVGPEDSKHLSLDSIGMLMTGHCRHTNVYKKNGPNMYKVIRYPSKVILVFNLRYQYIKKL